MAELNITNIPAPRVPLIDERTGLMAREWYRFFQNIFILTGSGSNPTTLDELQIGPPTQLDFGGVTSVTGTPPVVSSGGTTPTISMPAATTSVNGYLTSTDWTTFNNKGTVSSVSVVSANGLAGTVATATTTPAVTLSTTVTGVLKGNGTAISAATSGTDYAPATSGTSILYGNGAGGFSNVTIGTGVAFTTGTLSATGLGGDVVGPASATDNAISRFDNTTGKLIQNSVTTIDDTGAATGFTTFAASTSVTTPTVQASNSAGLSLKNASGTTQINTGAGGGDNVSINVSTNLNGVNAQIDISPTGTGHVHIKPSGTGSIEIAPTNVGTIDNMTIGATAPKNGSFVDLSVTGTTSFDGAQGTAGQVLTSAGTGATPTWTTPTTGTVTAVSVVSANGLAGTSSGGATPALTLSTTVTGVVKGNGTALSAAVAATDYVAPSAYASANGLTMATSRLLGRTTASTGAAEEISVAGGLTLSAGTLTGASGTVTSVAALTLGTSGTDLTSTVANGTTTPVITLQVPTASASNRGALSSTDWSTFNSKGSGTVTSVAQSFTGGLISVAGSPITTSGTLALTVAGTSGGVPYFSSASTWATSAALAASALVIGGGAGAAPATTTTGTGVVTALGVNTGTAGAFVVNGGALGTPSSGTVTNLTGTASININGTVGATTPTTGAFTTLSATDVATFAAGTVSLPSITTSGDTNTGVYFPAADTIAFTEGGAEAMRIDSSGNLGIGTSSPATFGKFVTQTSTSANTPIIAITNNSASPQLNHYITDSGSTVRNLNQIGFNTGSTNSANYQGFMTFSTMASAGGTISERMRINASGNVGIGTGATINYKLEISTDSAGKPGVGGLWTVVSDERIKSNIVPANLDRCYEIVKSVPLKHFGFAPGVYTDDQINDKHNLGWIAQDVQKVFKNAVSVKPFTLTTGDVIEDCLDLNSGQIIAALYGCVQALMAKVEALEAKMPPASTLAEQILASPDDLAALKQALGI